MLPVSHKCLGLVDQYFGGLNRRVTLKANTFLEFKKKLLACDAGGTPWTPNPKLEKHDW